MIFYFDFKFKHEKIQQLLELSNNSVSSSKLKKIFWIFSEKGNKNLFINLMLARYMFQRIETQLNVLIQKNFKEF